MWTLSMQHLDVGVLVREETDIGRVAMVPGWRAGEVGEVIHSFIRCSSFHPILMTDDICHWSLGYKNERLSLTLSFS